MKFFEVLIRQSDNAGNDSFQHHAYVTAPSLAAALQIYPAGFVVGFRLKELLFEPLPSVPVDVSAVVQNLK
jgi:hypothetical protein